ncbi:mitochondrial distribution and morphology protein 34 [Tremella mesenterica]|uniref:Mitochondrial distribution and morphology protein 34 n=1 Tax=Tremella mesenterica TaxID=5217 RepID=A0A4Q1BUY6_TREME|nr:mitochondrial distribution and morphology protein 34 [Tremella mesenterica]
MSFTFPSWATAFSPGFIEDAKAMLEGALNKGNKPPVIQGRIEVVDMSMGQEPPTLTLLEIGDLSLDRFRGILRLGYQGDAWIQVRCRVQANPLSHNPNLLPSSTLPLSTPLLASQPLLVPMTLRLSRLHLRAILILVVSASKGITLVFKNDPLQNVDVSSTFDSIEVIRGYLQQEIEGQLREMFREDLPGIIHRLSQRWFTDTGTGGKVELAYAHPINSESSMTENEDEDEDIDNYSQKPIFPPYVPSPSRTNLTPRRRAQQQARARRSSLAASDSLTSYTVFPDIEDYDPTYGLRPEGVPTHSGYEAFGRLWEKAREGEGLGGLMKSQTLSQVGEDRGDVSDTWDEDDEDDETRSFDMVEMEESLRVLPSRPGGSRRLSRDTMLGPKMTKDIEWETFTAVGGGTITRPRVYHTQSRIRAPSDTGGIMPSPGGTATNGSVTARASSIGGASSTIGSPRVPPTPHPPTPGPRSHLFPSATHPGPGPSSLRRLATSRSDIFSSHQIPRSESLPFPQSPPPPYRSTLSRQQSTITSSHTKTGSSNWTTDKARSQTLTNLTSASSIPIDTKSSIRNRQSSLSISVTGTSPGTSFPPRNSGMEGITLPNNSVSQLATLSYSAHTLSPYARGHEHTAFRSFPHLGKTNSGMSTPVSAGVPVKARRKRLYRLSKPDTTSGVEGQEKEILSTKSDSPPRKSMLGSEPTPSRKPSSSSGGWSGPTGMGYGGMYGGGWRQGGHGNGNANGSLTGMAQKVMRPNIVRAPESRTSYGFPATRIDKIVE